MIDQGRIGFATEPTNVTVEDGLGHYTLQALVAGGEIATGSASVGAPTRASA